MALIARIQHPYIVEFKEAWVEKVREFVIILINFVMYFSNLICPQLESPCVFVIM
jgi:hypothetical protein